ncbi:MAG: hypothetical protein V4485_06460 [Pseudomonadota bacterium]
MTEDKQEHGVFMPLELFNKTFEFINKNRTDEESEQLCMDLMYAMFPVVLVTKTYVDVRNGEILEKPKKRIFKNKYRSPSKTEDKL